MSSLQDELIFFEKSQKNIWKNKNYFISLQSQIQRILEGKPKRSVRLGVRTPGFHPGNRGSIPLRTAKRKHK